MSTLEIEIDRQTFLSTLYKAQGVVDRKSTVSVLSHILVEPTTDEGIRVTGTDYDVVLKSELGARVIKSGRACIHGKSLFDVVKSLNSETVHLRATENHWVEVDAGRSNFKLAGIDPTDFPEIQDPDEVAFFGMARATLKDLIEKTSFSVSGDETRMNLNGVFLKVEPAEDPEQLKMTLVSTDGHRLSKVEVVVDATGYDGNTYQAIIHRKGVQEIRRLLEDDHDQLNVGFARGHVLFQSGGNSFTVRQIEDTYPDYARVIPPSSSIKIEVNRQAMIQALRRIAILTSSKTYIIKMELEQGRLAFATSNPDYGEGRDEIDVDYSGDQLVVGFNYSYLLDVLGVLRSDNIVLECSDAFSPAVITSPSEEGALFVVMPMRI